MFVNSPTLNKRAIALHAGIAEEAEAGLISAVAAGYGAEPH